LAEFGTALSFDPAKDLNPLAKALRISKSTLQTELKNEKKEKRCSSAVAHQLQNKETSRKGSCLLIKLLFILR
jgi:hypothetical protein